MSVNEIDFEIDEDDAVDPNEHLKLIKAIGKLDKTQHIKKPSRDGISDIKSEFHVRNSHPGSNVAVSDLINVLQKTGELADVGKKIKVAQTINKTLQKPIEKLEAEKIKRATGFEEVKKSLGKWDAVVSRNRTLEHQKFPLNNEKVGQLKSKELLAKFSIKSELENELDQLNTIEDKKEDDDDENTFPMTMAELIEHRKEMARLRAKQSYKEAKARRQGKIKSKKFHRIQRKEKIKQQLKEFEQLQKTDPEEALRKLEQLEKTRALERVTLRHKSTGQWAKNKLVRAKYDKETRQQLAEQLAISRELTQKQKVEETDSEEENKNEDNEMEVDASNPWLSKGLESKEVTDFVSGYRKYWEERNKVLPNSLDNVEDTALVVKQNVENLTSTVVNDIKIEEKLKDNNKTELKSVPRKRKMKELKSKSTTEWVVEDAHHTTNSTKVNKNYSDNKSLNEIFDDVEWKLQNKVNNKLNKLKSNKNNEPKKNDKKNNKKSNKNKNDKGLEFKKRKLVPEIDEQLQETTTTSNNDIGMVSDKLLTKESDNKTVTGESEKIDPDKFVAIKPRHLKSALPDIETEGDHMDDDEDERKLTIAEAFEDDDIVAEFQQEKENEVNKDKPKIEDITMPGWGSWAGKNLKAPRRRRMILNKTPVVFPRKDDKKDNVYINEKKSVMLKTHQVSELPFPFASVADFEASIRAPIGNTFIPESAHRKHIKPAVIVKKGHVIEPMDESQLVIKKKVSIKNNASYEKPLFRKIKTK